MVHLTGLGTQKAHEILYLLLAIIGGKVYSGHDFWCSITKGNRTLEANRDRDKLALGTAPKQRER